MTGFFVSGVVLGEGGGGGISLICTLAILFFRMKFKNGIAIAKNFTSVQMEKLITLFKKKKV